LRDAAAQIFSPAFLWMVHRRAHGQVLRSLGLDRVLHPRSSVAALFDVLYSALERDYRAEYYFKNEIIRRIFEARHNPNRSAVLLEKHIGNWASRVDLIVVNDTTTAYEIKTDYDDLSRVRSQTDLALRVFDRVYVVCSDRRTESVREMVDDRVGVLGLRPDSSFRRDRAAVPNAEFVDPVTVFDLLRQNEYLEALERRFGPLPKLDPVERYGYCSARFSQLPPATAYSILLNALRRRHVRADRDPLARLPYPLGHLYYKATVKEREMLFAPELLRYTLDRAPRY
jgi:hypothetical protein